MRLGLVILLLAWGLATLRAQAPARSSPGAAQAAALARQVFVSLPPPPAWEQAGAPTVWSIEDIQAEFAKVTSTPPQVNFIRTQFLQSNHEWLTHFKDWFRSLEKPLKMRFEDQVWDCDDYANCFVAFADLLAMRAGETRGAFCVGVATVYYDRPWAEIRNGVHAVAIVGTTRGLFVIEPQNGTMVALKNFPNRDTIAFVYF